MLDLLCLFKYFLLTLFLVRRTMCYILGYILFIYRNLKVWNSPEWCLSHKGSTDTLHSTYVKLMLFICSHAIWGTASPVSTMKTTSYISHQCAIYFSCFVTWWYCNQHMINNRNTTIDRWRDQIIKNIVYNT